AHDLPAVVLLDQHELAALRVRAPDREHHDRAPEMAKPTRCDGWALIVTEARAGRNRSLLGGLDELLWRLVERVAAAAAADEVLLAHIAHLDRRRPAGDDALRLLDRRPQRLALLVPGQLVDRREEAPAALLLLELDHHPDAV